MCSGGSYDTPEVKEVEPVKQMIANTAPPPERVAEAPVINETAKRNAVDNAAKRKGTAALRINLNVGGLANGAAGNNALRI